MTIFWSIVLKAQNELKQCPHLALNKHLTSSLKNKIPQTQFGKKLLCSDLDQNSAIKGYCINTISHWKVNAHVVWRDFTKVRAVCLQGFLVIGTQAISFFLFFWGGWKSTKEKTRCTLILTYLWAKIARYYQTQSSWVSLYFPKYFCLHFQARGTYRLSLSTGQSAGNSKGRLEMLKDSSPMMDCFPELTFDTWNIVTF